ncbi:MAG: tetratricopeptide repeat protein [Clostridium sp.]|nr:tetratricopeptide repeat protein [Clostridium sp.]
MSNILFNKNIRYYDKKDRRIRKGECKFCGKVGKLESYTGNKFFAISIIPLIPLGKKRIQDHCEHCKKYYVTGFKKWEEESRSTIESAYEIWVQNRSDTGAIKKLFGALAYFGGKDKLDSIAMEVGVHCADNGYILNQLGLVYSFLNFFEEAQDFFNRSLSIKGDRDIEENLAEALAKNLKPDEARPYLAHILNERLTDKLYYINLLIESYQHVGNHVSALEVIREYGEAFPYLMDKNPLRKYRKISQRRSKRPRRIKGRMITQEGGKSPVFAFKPSDYIFPILCKSLGMQ